MPNDAAIAKLLYTILKQLDLKSVCKLFLKICRAVTNEGIGQLERGCLIAQYHERSCRSDALSSFQTADGRHSA